MSLGLGGKYGTEQHCNATEGIIMTVITYKMMMLQ
jgi:hypothetical protein